MPWKEEDGGGDVGGRVGDVPALPLPIAQFATYYHNNTIDIYTDNTTVGTSLDDVPTISLVGFESVLDRNVPDFVSGYIH